MKRQRIEIMAQILAFCIQGRPKTHIMYGIKLSRAQLKTYLTLLTSRDLLARDSDRYVTTDKGHRFLETFVSLNAVLEDHTRTAFMDIINETYKEAEITPIGFNNQVEKRSSANPLKKAAIVVLISLAHEAEKKTSEELEIEIRKALEEGLARIPWVALEKVIVVEEKYSGARNMTKRR